MTHLLHSITCKLAVFNRKSSSRLSLAGFNLILTYYFWNFERRFFPRRAVVVGISMANVCMCFYGWFRITKLVRFKSERFNHVRVVQRQLEGLDVYTWTAFRKQSFTRLHCGIDLFQPFSTGCWFGETLVPTAQPWTSIPSLIQGIRKAFSSRDWNRKETQQHSLRSRINAKRYSSTRSRLLCVELRSGASCSLLGFCLFAGSRWRAEETRRSSSAKKRSSPKSKPCVVVGRRTWSTPS